MKTLYIVRGLPGSGKTTLAQEIADMAKAAGRTACIVAADDFRYNDAGEYIFRPEETHHCHAMCQTSASNAMFAGAEVVVVHNTFCVPREMKPYHKLAEIHGYRVIVMVVENHHGNVSVHNVPEETMEHMRSRFTLKL